jgi:hypothetical protein
VGRTAVRAPGALPQCPSDDHAGVHPHGAAEVVGEVCVGGGQQLAGLELGLSQGRREQAVGGQGSAEQKARAAAVPMRSFRSKHVFIAAGMAMARLLQKLDTPVITRS